jgi:UDP-apiose/xylose synthase
VRLHPIKEVSSREFYGEGYEDCDRRVPDITKAKRLLGWSPTKSLPEILTETIAYYYQEFGPSSLPVAAE